MSDLAFAAAAAGVTEPMGPADGWQVAVHGVAAPEEVPDAGMFELPNVDDLEVAAAAAAAAMQAMRELGQASSSSSSGTDDSSGTSSGTDDSGTGSDTTSDDEDDAEDTMGRGAPGPPLQSAHQALQVHDGQPQALALRLLPGPEGLRVQLQLGLADLSTGVSDPPAHTTHMHATTAHGNGNGSSSRGGTTSSDKSAEDSDAESLDYGEMRAFIDQAYARAAEDEDGGDAGGPPPSLQADLGLPEHVVPLPELTLPPGAELKQAGEVTSILEGMVVVQGLANARALDEGSVLLLEGGAPLGRVEEVFGPLAAPLYALRYAGPVPEPATLVPGARVMYCDAHAQLVGPALYEEAAAAAVSGQHGSSSSGVPPRRRGPGAPSDGDVLDDGEEPQFSDDEAEAEWRRSQGLTKRKAPDPGSGRGAGMRGGRRGGSRAGGRGSISAPTPPHHQPPRMMGLQAGSGSGQPGGSGSAVWTGRVMHARAQGTGMPPSAGGTQLSQQQSAAAPSPWPVQPAAAGFAGYGAPPYQAGLQQQQQQQTNMPWRCPLPQQGYAMAPTQLQHAWSGPMVMQQQPQLGPGGYMAMHVQQQQQHQQSQQQWTGYGAAPPASGPN